MRSKKALMNSSSAIIAEIVSIICGFILPRLILSEFSSNYNGITASIVQFISCVTLLRAGVGGVTRAALYKPLADNNTIQISKIVKATDIFMRKVGLIFATFLVVFACVYPFFVSDEFEWFFSFSLVLIIGISTFAQNFFGITYQMLIQADQRKYIYTLLTIVTTILNTVIAASLIKLGATIHVVKFGSAIVFMLNPILLNLYVRKKYKIDRSVEPNNIAITQRWDAFAQQVAAFVNNNTDVIVLTIFCNMKEVSVYTIYHMIANGLYKIENTFSDGIGSAFGNMMAKKEEESLQRNFKLFEFFVFAMSAFLFISGGVLIVSFVEVYTRGVKDVSYARPAFGILMCINQFLFCVRLPYQMIADAAGHFKQTKKGAIFESILNIVISVVLVSRWGLIGVTIGTFCALSFRTFQYAIYTSRHILNRSIIVVVKRFFTSVLEALTVVIILFLLPDIVVTSYMSWVLNAIIVALVTIAVIAIYSVILFKKETILILKKIQELIYFKRNKNNKVIIR